MDWLKIRKERLWALAGIAAMLLLYGAVSVNAQHEVQPPAASQKPSADSLSIERVAAEPDLGPQVRPEAFQQAPLLHWSPDGARVAWLHLAPPPQNSAVKTAQREIWSLPAEAIQLSAAKPSLLVSAVKVTAALRGTETPRPLSIGDDDKGNPDLLQDFAWSPNHASLLLQGATSLAWMTLATGQSRVLITGDEPILDAAFSPDGRTVSFVREGGLWILSLAGGPARPLAHSPKADVLEGGLDWPYRNELHMARGYAWSPDSSQIAYLETDDQAVAKATLRHSDGSKRTFVSPKPGGAIPAVRILVKRLAGGLPVAINLGPVPANGMYLPRFTWLPDGQHLAIERLDRRQQTLELFLADAATGKAKLILSENDKYWINLSNDFHFLRDGKRFVWSSERTGFRHLYLYDTVGKQLAQLTQGEWEVTQVNAVDEARSLVYFTATEKSPLERHLYSVGLAGGETTRITQRAGTHEAHFSPDATAYLDCFSSHEMPPVLALAAANREAAFSEEPTATPKLQPVEYLNFKLHMGTEVHAFLIKPPAFDPAKKYPVIVYLAGGPGEQLVRDAWGGATGLWMQLMAQKGFLIFALDNQGTAGRGHFFEEPLHFRLAAQEMIDQRDGVSYLLDLPFVDQARMGVAGWGYGGFLAVHAMLDRPIPYKAGFAGAPVIDWHFYNAVFAERYLDDPVAHQDGWLSSTAFENAKYFKGPLFIAQGTADERVSTENIDTLQDSLLDNGKSSDLLLMPDRGHSIEDTPARTVLFRRMTDFFIKNL